MVSRWADGGRGDFALCPGSVIVSGLCNFMAVAVYVTINRGRIPLFDLEGVALGLLFVVLLTTISLRYAMLVFIYLYPFDTRCCYFTIPLRYCL